MAAKKRPGVLIFQLSDIPNGEYRASQAGVSDRVSARPFYLFDSAYQKLYDRKVKRSPDLPKEPKFPKAEDKAGYAFYEDLINQEFVDASGITKLLQPRGGYLKWYSGWHNAADIEALRGAFSSA